MAGFSTNATTGAPHACIGFAAALSAVVLLAATNITFPMGRGQATHSLIVENLLRGRALYFDLRDHKPPGIFHLYAVIVKIFGPVMWDELIGDLERTPPFLIVVARDGAAPGISHAWRDSEQCLQIYPVLANFIHNRYSPKLNIEDFEVYRLHYD